MSEFNHYVAEGEDLNKDSLIGNENFIDDASSFLVRRGGYKSNELDTNQKVYDAYMEHFRSQNVNEVTALKDMAYAQEADEDARFRMGKLMDTFDRMDSDFGWTAIGDYFEGVATAPSTYAGIFTGGAAKAGQLAVNAGVKVGIREAIKRGGIRSAARAMAIEAPVAAGTVAAQEQTRVETGLKEEIDMTQVAASGAIATATGGLLGGLTGTHTALRSAQAEEIVKATTKEDVAIIEAGHELTKKVFKGGDTAKEKLVAKTAKKMQDSLIADKKSLAETIPEELALGKQLKEKLADDADMLPGLDEQLIQNISAASAKVYHLIPPRYTEDGATRLVAGSAEDLQERFTSRVSRAVREGIIDKDQIRSILDDHGVTSQQLGTVMAADGAALIAEEISRAGRLLRGQRTAKEAVQKLQLELNEIDDGLLDMGDFTSKGYRRLQESVEEHKIKDISLGFKNLNKARVGLMTIQAATTVRNTTNGYMRNFVYALDNLGTGAINYAKGNFNKLRTMSDAQATSLADKDVRLGRAQLRTGIDSLLFKDLIFGMNSATTVALTRLMADDKFGATGITRQLFRDMGDVGNITGAEKGIIGVARKLNYFNTMSDNMFKRAIFARELDKQIFAASDGKRTLRSVLADGDFAQVSAKTESMSEAMEKALDFTYQTGKFRGKDGVFNAGADMLIKFGQSTGGSLAIPFPRYMVNQFRFMYEHAPVFGMFDFGTGILNKSSYADRAGKQLTGLAMLGTFAALRNTFGDENTGPYEYLDPTTRGSFDMRASFGPFSAYAMFADYMYRNNFGNWHDNDKVAADLPYSAKEFVNAVTGGQGRAGTQLDMIDATTDVIINGLDGGLSEDEIWQAAARTLGNYFNTYTVGAGVLKDIVISLDPEFRQLPNNDDVEIIPYMLKQATKSFPQTIGDDAQGILGYKGIGPQRDRLESPTRVGGLRSMNPFIKQLTGLTPRGEKKPWEKEFDRLNLEYFELSPRRIKLDAPLTNQMRGMMGLAMERDVSRYVLGQKYNNIKSDKIKRIKLKEFIDAKRTAVRNLVLDNQRLDHGLSEEEQNRRDQVTYLNKVPKKQRVLIEESYKYENDGRTIADDNAWEYAITQAKRLKDGGID